MESPVAISSMLSKTYKTFGEKLFSSFIAFVKSQNFAEFKSEPMILRVSLHKKLLSLKSINEWFSFKEW